MTDSRGVNDLTLASIQSQLKTHTLGHPLHLLPSTESTNAAALTFAQQGAPHGTVVVADQQTAGKGRLGRQWISPAGQNVYCSVIVNPVLSTDQYTRYSSWLPLSAGLAAANTVQEVTTLHASLKWPNDIMLGEKKAGGVLCETVRLQDDRLGFIVGIGLNVNLDLRELPPSVREHATSLARETGSPLDRNRVVAVLLAQFEHCLTLLSADRHADLVHDYGRRCSTVGRRVTVHLADGQIVEGDAQPIGDDGFLTILPKKEAPSPRSATPVVIQAGDVVHVR